MLADTPVNLTLDGRPISRKADVALERNGAMFVDAVDFTRVFNGLLVFGPEGAVKIIVRGHSSTFVPGNRVAHIDGKAVKLPEAPFVHNGDLYVPVSVILGSATGISLHRIDATHADLHLTVFAGATDNPRQSPASVLAVVPSASVASDGLHVMVTVRNTQDTPYALTFPTSARATFMIDRDGVNVWSSSQGKRYLQALYHTSLPPDGAFTFSDVWPAWNGADPGRYQLRVRVMLSPPLESSPVSLGVK